MDFRPGGGAQGIPVHQIRLADRGLHLGRRDGIGAVFHGGKFFKDPFPDGLGIQGQPVHLVEELERRVDVLRIRGGIRVLGRPVNTVFDGGQQIVNFLRAAGGPGCGDPVRGLLQLQHIGIPLLVAAGVALLHGFVQHAGHVHGEVQVRRGDVGMVFTVGQGDLPVGVLRLDAGFDGGLCLFIGFAAQVNAVYIDAGAEPVAVGLHLLPDGVRLLLLYGGLLPGCLFPGGPLSGGVDAADAQGAGDDDQHQQDQGGNKLFQVEGRLLGFRLHTGSSGRPAGRISPGGLLRLLRGVISLLLRLLLHRPLLVPGSIIPLRGLLLCLGSLVAVLCLLRLRRAIFLPGRFLRNPAARRRLLRGIVSMRRLLLGPWILLLLCLWNLLLLPGIPGQLFL